MEKRDKKLCNALFLYQNISSDKEITLDMEILLGNNSLNAIKQLLQKKFPVENRSLRKPGLISIINQLFKDGLISKNGNLLNIKARENHIKSSEETEVLGKYLIKVLPDNPENDNSWSTFSGVNQLIFAYLKNFIQTEQNSQQQFIIFDRFVRFLILSGQFKNALLTIKLVSKSVQTQQKSHFSTSIFTAYKAEIFRMKGKNMAAEKMLRPAIHRLEKQALQNQIQLAQLYDILGLVLLYDDKLRFSEAEKYLQRALVIRQINFGSKHISTISSNFHMAEYYNQTGAGNKAFECIKNNLEHLTPLKNRYFEAVANDIMGLASFYIGNKTEAIEYCEKGLLARRKFLKKGHPLLLESLHNVGYLLFLSSKPSEAIEYINQTYADFKKAFTPEHQNYTITVGVTAICNMSLNKIDRAEKILVKEADALLKFPRENYKLYSVALEELIRYYRIENLQLKEKKLIRIYIKLLNSRRLKFDQKYYNMLNRYFKLLRIAGSLNEIAWVKKELSSCLFNELQQKLNTQKISEDEMNYYGVTFKNSFNDYDRAEECYNLSFKINPEYSITHSNYALLLTSIKGEHDTAEHYYIKSIKLDPLNDVAIGNYALFLQNIRKKFTESEICYLEALALSNNDRCTLANYASLKLIQGDFEEAKKLASKSLRLCIPEPNRYMARVLLIFIVIRMFECKNYEDLLGQMKFLFAYGMEHVTWDNREFMAVSKKILCADEFDLVQKIFNTINDYNCFTELWKLNEWKKIEPLPFVSAYNSPFE